MVMTLTVVFKFPQTFHTPSFGDEEFDIPELHQTVAQPQQHQIDQYHHQMQSHQLGLMSEQQTTPAAAAYGQWQHQQPTAESHMIANQTYQLQPPNHSNYHQMSSPNQAMLLMQPNALQTTQNQQHIQQLPTQLHSAYTGQSPPQTVGSDENEDSDDNALTDANVSFLILMLRNSNFDFKS